MHRALTTKNKESKARIEHFMENMKGRVRPGNKFKENLGSACVLEPKEILAPMRNRSKSGERQIVQTLSSSARTKSLRNLKQDTEHLESSAEPESAMSVLAENVESPARKSRGEAQGGALSSKIPSSRDRRIEKAASPMPTLGRNESSSPTSVAIHPSSNSDDPMAWFSAIEQRDWELVEQLITTYDHKKYRKLGLKTGKSKKTQKKLRVLKYLPSKESSRKHNDEGAIAPLLQTDQKGRTALHLACLEIMPWKFVQSIFFLERGSVFVTDNDGRLPLHLAMISNHNKHVLDRVIKANPSALLLPDELQRTPMAYAILRADHKRDKSLDITWREPLTEKEGSWQVKQQENWESAQFFLECLVTRRKPLSKIHEKSLLIEAVKSRAPPSVINLMLSVSARILQEDQDMAVQLIQLLSRYHYSISLFQKTIKICGSTMPSEFLKNSICGLLLNHYEEGSDKMCRQDFQRDMSFRSELLQAYKRKHLGQELNLTSACIEWKSKMQFFLCFASSASLNGHTVDDSLVLPACLRIRETPASLIEFFVRLFPVAIFEKEPDTGALPIHLGCMYWHRRLREIDNQTATQTFNMLVNGDRNMARTRYQGRYPLHMALFAGQSPRVIDTLIKLYPKATKYPDPLSRLYPFQMAAINTASFFSPSSNPADDPEAVAEGHSQLDLIYEAMRLYPVAVYPAMSCGSGNPDGDLGPVGQHVLNWCYSYQKTASVAGWVLNQPRIQILRRVISDGQLPDAMSKWFKKLKTYIWRVYDRKNAGKIIVCMPRENSFLLHAALSNGGTPPIAIELLLELFPESVRTAVPGTEQYPIHIAAESPTYTPMPFESVISLSSYLEMIVLADPCTLHLKVDNRDALEIAIRSGKTYGDLKPLLDQDTSLLTTRGTRGLFPFQEIACAENLMPVHKWMHVKTYAMSWSARTTEENGILLKDFRRDYQREKTSSIFEMLRSEPKALEACLSGKDAL